MINMVVAIFLGVGTFFILVSAIGLLRFPDFYTRLHATGKCDTLGSGLVILGLIIYHLFHYPETPPVVVKLLFLLIFLFITIPTATHAILRSAYQKGVKPWKSGDKRG